MARTHKFVHIRRRSYTGNAPPLDPDDRSAAPGDVLFAPAGAGGQTKVFHYTRVPSQGPSSPKGTVLPHSAAHHQDPEHTIPEVSKGREESLVWIAEESFSVQTITPSNPFGLVLPAASQPDPSGAFWFVVSGAPVHGAPGTDYKTTFKFGNLTVDPHFKVGP